MLRFAHRTGHALDILPKPTRLQYPDCLFRPPRVLLNKRANCSFGWLGKLVGQVLFDSDIASEHAVYWIVGGGDDRPRLESKAREWVSPLRCASLGPFRPKNSPSAIIAVAFLRCPLARNWTP